MNVRGKVVLITGAAQGLGQKMAELLAREGADLALADVDQEKLAATSKACSSHGNRVKGYVANVAEEPSVVRLFQHITDDLGGVDGLVNNAGINRDALLVKVVDGRVQGKMSLEQFDKVIAVDLRGAFLCGREAAIQMIERGRRGVIINISSISRVGNVGQTNYSAAKAGLAAMTVCWAKELARYGIRAAAIAPGFSNTRMVSSIPAKIRDGIISRVAPGRLAHPEEIAHAVLFILQNDYFNGRVLELDGGLRL